MLSELPGENLVCVFSDRRGETFDDLHLPNQYPLQSLQWPDIEVWLQISCIVNSDAASNSKFPSRLHDLIEKRGFTMSYGIVKRSALIVGRRAYTF